MRIAPVRPTGAAEVPEMTMSSAVFGMPSAPTPVMICGEARGIGDEIAVRIGAQQRNRADVLVGQEDAEHLWPVP